MNEPIWFPPGVPTVQVDQLVPCDWNVNEQDPATFKNLVDNIRKHGFLEPLLVTPIGADLAHYLTPAQVSSGEEFYLIVGGHHRHDAARMLDLTEVPVIIRPDFTEDMVKLSSVRMNALKGRISPEKFVKLYQEMVAKGYGDDVLQDEFGLAKRNAMKKLVKAATKGLPENMKVLVEEAAQDVEDMDDLGRVLKELLSKHGDTLPFGYIIMEYGRKTCYWVRMDQSVRESMDRIADTCYAQKVDLNRVLAILLTDTANVRAALSTALAQAAADDDVFA